MFVHVDGTGELDLSTVSETKLGAMLRRINTGGLPDPIPDYDNALIEYAEVSNGGTIECVWLMQGNPPPEERLETPQLEVLMSDAAMRVGRTYTNTNHGTQYTVHHVFLRKQDLAPCVCYYPADAPVSVVFGTTVQDFLRSNTAVE
jgi:hypothetical protein